MTGNSCAACPGVSRLRVKTCFDEKSDEAFFNALVAQLDRVLLSEGKGWRFKSSRAHQFFLISEDIKVGWSLLVDCGWIFSKNR